jgi:hypothetical protein
MRRFRRGRDGQTLAEFALVLPLFILLLTAVIEFALIMNAVLAINFASRDASLVAAEAGDDGTADCEILASIERSVSSPANPALITKVRIYRFPTASQPSVWSDYTRTGSMTCNRPNGTSLSVPYSPVGGAQNYTPAVRCNRLAGCNGGTVIDQVGVEITYGYKSHTPIGTLFGSATLVRANVMRMEPVL